MICISLALCTVLSESALIASPLDRAHSTALQAVRQEKTASRHYLDPRYDGSEGEIVASRGYEMSPRAARIETPLRAAFGSSGLMWVPPAYAAQDSFVAFESTMRKYFPKALPTSVISTKVRAALAARKFTRFNTLYGTSISPDEINTKPTESLSIVLEDYLSKHSGIYVLGGIGGLSLQGVQGMEEFLSHCPRGGKVFILFGPNVGISDNGTIGMVERLGQTRVSECCEPGLWTFDTIRAQIKLEKERQAAALGAAEAEIAEEAAKQKTTSRFGRREQPAPEVEVVATATAPMPLEETSIRQYNAALYSQTDFIVANLREYVDTPEASRVSKPDIPAFITLQMFKLGQGMILEQLEACLNEQSRREDILEVVILGGVIVNRGQVLGSIEPREDYFQPLVFKSFSGEVDMDGNLESTDLYAATFGDLPAFLRVN